MTIVNLSETLNKSQKDMMKEMQEFNELYTTIGIVTHYTKLLNDINKKI